MNIRIFTICILTLACVLPLHTQAAGKYTQPSVTQNRGLPDRATIRWERDAEDVKNYRITLYRGWRKNALVQTYTSTNLSNTVYRLRNLDKGMRYGIRLQAEYTDGTRSPYSKLVHFITPPRRIVRDADPIPSAGPNIIMVVTDDQRADTIEYMPTLTALADDGTRFTRGYVTTPVCCPSRSSILTGQYSHNHGVLTNSAQYGFNAFSDSETLATWLQAAGYTTGLIGKYLNGYEANSTIYVPPGWDTFQSFVDNGKYYRYSLTEYVDRSLSKNSWHGEHATEYSTDVLTEKAVNFIENTETEDDTPFFLLFTPHSPHKPYTPSPTYKDTLTDLEPYAPDSLNEPNVSDKTGFVQGLEELSDEELADVETIRQSSLETLLSVDESLATFIDTLEEAGELENTVIIFLSDNGYHWGEHRIPYGKSSPYEEAVKVPFVVYDGRNPVAQERDELLLNIDIAPTILALAGAEIPDTVDGQSFADIISGATVDWREDFLIENWNDQPYADPFVATHEGDWVYIHFDNGTEELYNLAEDPYQITNLAAEDAYADRMSDMRSRTITLMQCSGTEQCN